MHFTEFNLIPDLIKGIEEAGYTSCTEVQQETLSHTLSGKDVFVQSQTGTGKTAAFLISLFESIERGEERESALIITPTRELAVQIAEEAKLLSLYLDFNIACIFGGVGYTSQQHAIEKGIDICIGTPGRVIDMSKKGILNLSQFNYVVIDEADRMFDMGFFQDIQTIFRRLPPRTSRQTMLFSATLSPAVKRLASSSMNEPVEVHIVTENITVDTINQQVYHVGSTQKMELLLGVLNKFSTPRTLIFVNMKQMAEEVAERLRGNGIDAEYLTGDLAQRQRQRRIDRFKKNELPVLVATDVAARGIHIDDLELVVNYDIPMHCENYVHRIGRTARAGKSGHAITLACEIFVEFLAPIEQFIKMKIPSVVAEEELYVADATAGKPVHRHRSRGKNYSGGNRDRSSKRYSSKKGPPHRHSTSRDRRRNKDNKTKNDYSGNSTRTQKNRSRNENSSAARDKKPQHKIQQRPKSTPTARKKAPPEKKGLFAKMISIFR